MWRVKPKDEDIIKIKGQPKVINNQGYATNLVMLALRACALLCFAFLFMGLFYISFFFLFVLHCFFFFALYSFASQLQLPFFIYSLPCGILVESKFSTTYLCCSYYYVEMLCMVVVTIVLLFCRAFFQPSFFSSCLFHHCSFFSLFFFFLACHFSIPMYSNSTFLIN